MATKRQTTFAKLDRERAVREKRARKQEKRDERKAAKEAGVEIGGEVEVEGEVAPQPDDAADPE